MRTTSTSMESSATNPAEASSGESSMTGGPSSSAAVGVKAAEEASPRPLGTATIATRISVILFYKYHPLSANRSLVELYRTALETLCEALRLKGRILVGCNPHRSEGINGTLSGRTEALHKFVAALSTASREEVAEEYCSKDDPTLERFWNECQDFYRKAVCPSLVMDESDFKWSVYTSPTTNEDCAHSTSVSTAQKGDNSTPTAKSLATENGLFPDLNIKIVSELIGTGGILAQIPLEELHQGYLTPREWHERVKVFNDASKNNEQQHDNDTILVDCRNTKECQIGHFQGALDPQTTTFNQFTSWVLNHQHTLENKKVLMYCTGGIRCEKASAFIRRAVPSVQEVCHLKGGIHKYLEEYSDDGGKEEASMWKGKNFVFDGRGAHGSAAGTSRDERKSTSEEQEKSTNDNQHKRNEENIVGSCRYCNSPYDTFDPHCVCTVCREPTLVCLDCQENGRHREYHCNAHRHLQECYFTHLELFSVDQLEDQMKQLRLLIAEIAVGKKYRARRKTLCKQCDKVQARLQELGTTVDSDGISEDVTNEWKCRNCGSTGCSGRCWGFHSLKRKRILEDKEQVRENDEALEAASVLQQNHLHFGKNGSSPSDDISSTPHNRGKIQQKQQAVQKKEMQRQQEIMEWTRLGLLRPPWISRSDQTEIRVPPSCTRVLHTTTKAKWCGKPLLKMLQTEYVDMKDSTRISLLFQNGLIRVNKKPVDNLGEAESLLLKNMDVISRIVHWHEPPIHLPTERIQVKRLLLPTHIISQADGEGHGEELAVYVCNKPSTVPVHPAGPYLSNSLTIMVEAQEGLPPKSLVPCHRIDRVTSGVMICCTHSSVARLIQTTIEQGKASGLVQKEYLAKVHGRFPTYATDAASDSLPVPDDLVRWKWVPSKQDMNGSTRSLEQSVLQIEAPIETLDPANGIRKITTTGKPSISRFKLLHHDTESDTSIVSCTPVTGRSHQLRVHLQWLGHSIVNDVQYGGKWKDCAKTFDDDSIAEYQGTVVDCADSSPSQRGAVTAIDEEAARRVCLSCTEGPSAAFTKAQLLQGGHAICLHALRYRLSLKPMSGGKSKKKKGKPTNLSGDEVQLETNSLNANFTLDCSVDVPSWAGDVDKRLF